MKRLSLALALSLALLGLPAAAASLETPTPEAAQAPHGQPAHGPAHAASCAEILAAQEVGHGDPTVSEVIFHHVSDSYAVEFESPLSHSSLKFDFKRGLCQLTGWNGVVHLGSLAVDLTPTKHAFWMWVAAVVLLAIFWIGAPKKGQVVASGLGAALEMLVLFVRDEIARKNIPDAKEADRYTPYLLTCFFFIFTMNMLGLIPYLASATSNVGVTLGLALLTFLFTQVAGIRAAGLGGYLKHLTGGVHFALWPIMIPVEFLGLFTKPFALTIRLFANMVAGHIVIYFLLGLIFIMKTIALAPVSVAFAFGIYLLELFVAFVQAYVFTMLSSLFIGFGVAMGHHGHAEDASGAHGKTHGEHAVHH